MIADIQKNMYLSQRPCVSSYVCGRHLASRWQAMSVRKLKIVQIEILHKPNSATAVKQGTAAERDCDLLCVHRVKSVTWKIMDNCKKNENIVNIRHQMRYHKQVQTN